MNSKINIVFCGYRSWAKNIINAVQRHQGINCVAKIFSYDEYEHFVDNMESSDKVFVFLGWSWIVPSEITSQYLCIGIHPSDLPHFRGGSPIQNQIMAGLLESKVSLMTLSDKKLDAGDIWGKNKFSLRGDNITKVFEAIEKSSVQLLNQFFDSYPNIVPINQNISEGSYYRRRKPEESRILYDDIESLGLEYMYNKIRSLTAPYPNAYFEDKNGNRLYIKEVVYETSAK